MWNEFHRTATECWQRSQTSKRTKKKKKKKKKTQNLQELGKDKKKKKGEEKRMGIGPLGGRGERGKFLHTGKNPSLAGRQVRMEEELLSIRGDCSRGQTRERPVVGA